MEKLEGNLARRALQIILLLLIVGLGLYFLVSRNPLAVLFAVMCLVLLGSYVVVPGLRKYLQLSSAESMNIANKDQQSGVNPYIQIYLNSLRSLLQVHSEKEILELVMRSGMQLENVVGASFVPYDEWGQSLPALVDGQVPDQAGRSLSERLSSPDTRQVCKNCAELHGGEGCVLIGEGKQRPDQVRCFPFSSAGREVGVVNFFFSNDGGLDLNAKNFLQDLLGAAGLALENMHSRDQEIAALHYLQTISSPISDLAELLNNLLENVQRALEVDFAMLYLPTGMPGQITQSPQFLLRPISGDNSSSAIPDMPFFEGIWKNVLSSGHSLSLENVIINKHEKWKTLLAVPLAWRSEEPAGVLILGSNSNQTLTSRHQALLETLAGQAALLIQNARLMVQVEYQAVVDERTRLAREIHDGLAQTLAFLKIQAGQMQNFLARGETEKLTNTLQANYRTLSDAYIDARQAIDNLRRVPTSNFQEWISQVAGDYIQITNQNVIVSVEEFGAEYPANIQTQLIRIVQEALSNIRKHADATKVEIVGLKKNDSYIIEIRDNGCGFTPNVGMGDGNFHYGLRGMRERSESIGADFQITSQIGIGTCVSICLPVALKEEL